MFDATATANGQPLALVRSGGVREVSSAFRDPRKECVLPVWRGSYPLDEPRPDRLVIELVDGSTTFHASVTAPAETPQLLLATTRASVGEQVDCDLLPAVHAASASVRVVDAIGTRRIADALNPSEGGLSFRIPDRTLPGMGSVEVIIPNWVAAEAEACDGPRICELSVRQSLGRYQERSTATTPLEVY